MIRDWRRKGEWLEWTAPSELFSLKEADPALLQAIGDRWLQRLEKSGGTVCKGRRLQLRLFPEEGLALEPDWADIGVLYEDDFCLIADKPAGMKVHPTQSGEKGTLLSAVAWHLEATGQRCRPRHIHRLDEDTTGPVLFAKHDWAQSRLDQAMRSKEIGREYIALVSGRMATNRGTIDAPIGRDRHHASRRRVSKTGEAAVTHYEVMERLPRATLVKLRLETGRTHQIRVHLSHGGHPLVGDSLYGGSVDPIGRQALHGAKLVCPHPLTGESVEAESPWPADFTALYERLKK